MARRFTWDNTLMATTRFMSVLEKELKQELDDQGHVARGTLKKSVLAEAVISNTRVQGTIRALARGEDLNKKQAPRQVSRAKIMLWMTAVNSSSSTKFSFTTAKEKKSIAHRIINAIAKEGIPTRGSYKFGVRRLGWIDYPFAKAERKVMSKLVPAVQTDIMEGIDRILDRLADRYRENIKIIK